MTEKSTKRGLKSWGFSDRSDFEIFLGNHLKSLEGPALEVRKAFEKELEQWINEYLNGYPERFVARIEAPPPSRKGRGRTSLLKTPERVAEKIFRSWRDYQAWEKKDKSRCQNGPPLRHDPQTFLQTIPDIVRFRIICNYLKDLKFIDNQLQTFSDRDPRFKVESREDHIDTLFPCSRVGHRAIEYTIRFKNEATPFLFEVQIMTQLQHAWDKKDHHLLYEPIRAGREERIPVQLRNRLAAMSELLYMADTLFDELLAEITKITQTEP